MKKILILGAGVYQVPLIKHAVERGYHVTVASWRATDPGMAHAHDTWVVDTKDKIRLCDLSRKYGIEAVLTTGTDVAIPSIGHICDTLKLPGISYKTAMAATDKWTMQQQFKAHGVPSSKSIRVVNLNQALEAVIQTGFPAMVKAPDSSGSRGIHRVDTPKDLTDALEDAMQISKAGYALVENYISGVEFGAQAVVLDGRVAKLICHNDTVTPPPVSVPIGHSCPLMMSREVQAETKRVCDLGVAAIGMKNGICNIDLMAEGDEVYMLEIGARTGATGIPEIILHSMGINLYDVAIDIAMGKRPRLTESNPRGAAVEIILSKEDGILSAIGSIDHLLALENVRAISFDCQPGDVVNRFVTGPDRLGEILCCGTTSADAEALCRHVGAHISLGLREHNS